MSTCALALKLTGALSSNLIGPLLLLLVALALIRYAVVLRSRKQRLPPGPSGHCLFGNTPLDAYPHRDFTRLAKTYGPVFMLRFGSRRLAVITSVESAVNIMAKQSHNLADRPQSVAAGLIGGGLRLVSMHVGDRLRKYRTPILDDPDRFIDHAKHYAASFIGITYGKTTPTTYPDLEVKQIQTSMERIAYAIRPGAYLVDSYPFLKYIPWLTMELKRYHQDDMALFHSQVQHVKERMMKNEVASCFTLSLLERQEESGLNDDELAYLAGALFSGGTVTTAAELSIVIMAAAHHPHSQARVQAQLDEVVGCDRLPSFADQSKLSEVCAFIQEVYRWRPLQVPKS
ncbi:cytochrome P450 [Cubamyces lactineus]|nr:cytochrome P450 [Cubamyces lactineus]